MADSENIAGSRSQGDDPRSEESESEPPTGLNSFLDRVRDFLASGAADENGIELVVAEGVCLWSDGWRLRESLEIGEFRASNFESGDEDLDHLRSGQTSVARVLLARLNDDSVSSVISHQLVFDELLGGIEGRLHSLVDEGLPLALRVSLLDEQLSELGRFVACFEPRLATHPLLELLRRIEKTRMTFPVVWETRSTLSVLDEDVRRKILEQCLREHDDRAARSEASVQDRFRHESKVTRILFRNLGDIPLDDEVLVGLRTCIGDLRVGLAGEIDGLESSEAASLLAPWEEDLRDRVEEELARATDRASERSVFTLDFLRLEIEWYRARLSRIASKSDPPAPGANRAAKDTRQSELKSRFRNLGRLHGRLRAEVQDRHVKGRLEKCLGRRGAVWLEGTILFLIVLVSGMLIFEVFSGPAPQGGETAPGSSVLRILDAAICCVFLAEFFLKLYLSRDRLFYFRRHLLTEFLPSIPYLIYARPLRALRLARLTRLARAFRLVVFAFRGLDRVAYRLSRLLHWNIVFFEPPRIGDPEAEQALDRAERFTKLKLRASARIRLASWALGPDVRDSFLAWRENQFRNQFERIQDAATTFSIVDGPASETLGRDRLEEQVSKSNREIRFELVIRKLVRLDPVEVEEALGPDICAKVGRVVSAFNNPISRNLPLLSHLARSARNDPFSTTVEAGKTLGRVLERGYGLLTWFSDLHGVVSGPQFVDRVGTGLAASTRRPAIRLLMLGALFVVTKAIVEGFDVRWSFLQTINDFLWRSLGMAIVILGVVCLCVHVLGLWLRRLAGEATDVYEKTAEAQYINLLKELKHRRQERDITILKRRVLSREPGLCDAAEWIFENRAGEPRWSGWEERQDLIALGERVRLLYLDYLDGSVLHKSDVKTTEQLLGNTTLENIRAARLRLGRKERKRLKKLDLVRDRTVAGPHFWFGSMFTAIQQQTAKLLMDYNRCCIPLNALEGASPETRARFRVFLERDLEVMDSRSDKAVERERSSFRHFVTTDFNALHFLSADSERDGFVRRRFGGNVADLLRADRRRMVRKVFGTYPFFARPRRDRVVNVFEIYLGYIRGGRVVLTPLWVGLLALRGTRWLIGQIVGMVRELLDLGRTRSATWEFHEASFEVAVRKINRMRKPVFVECMRMRTRFDPEFLGFPAPGLERSFQQRSEFEADLDFIGARVNERDEFEEIRAKTEEISLSFGRFLNEQGWFADDLDDYLDRISPELVGCRDEVRRAMWTAFAIDYNGVQTQIILPERIRSEFEEVLLRRPERTIAEAKARRFLMRLRPRRNREIRRAFARYWEHSGWTRRPAVDREACFQRCISDPVGLGRDLRSLDQKGGLNGCRENALFTMERIARDHVSWTRQLVTLRTVHAMAILDVCNDRRIVYDLGEYKEDGAPDPDLAFDDLSEGAGGGMQPPLRPRRKFF